MSSVDVAKATVLMNYLTTIAQEVEKISTTNRPDAEPPVSPHRLYRLIFFNLNLYRTCMRGSEGGTPSSAIPSDHLNLNALRW